MAFLTSLDDICELNTQSESEANIWQEDYPEFQRLADNGLLEDYDDVLPEVNDGSLSAALFKLPKRIVNSKLKGRARAVDSDAPWLTELANIEWEEEIIPNANTQAPFHRKWKDAVRKAGIFGSVPLITMFVERGRYIGADFIVAQPQDVRLAPGAVSDYDSNIFFWDGFYTKLQLEDMLERAEAETAEAKKNKEDGYNKWEIKALKELIADFPEEEDDNQNKPEDTDSTVKKKGVKLTAVFQRGIEAPFYLYHMKSKKVIREWSNPDPSGDVPVHFLYCYQDFVNPYGIGIVKLAGGTQNVLDYMRKADVLATQLGIDPPISIRGTDTTGLDIDSLTNSPRALWFEGAATVQRQEAANQVYSQLPDRMMMYKQSLNNLLPMGDTSISATAGDPLASKTPAGVKMAQAQLSIDDDDFKDNLYVTYEAKARSMINTHFANMQGEDLRKLSDEQRDILAKAGLEFPVDEEGNPTNELDIVWDNARASFTFEIDPESDKTKDDEKRLDGLLKVLEIIRSDPTIPQQLMQSGYQLSAGELIKEILSLTSDNDKIVEQISPEDQQQMQEQMMGQEAQPGIEQGVAPGMEQPQGQMMQEAPQPEQEPQADELIGQTMQQYGVDESTAMFMLEAAQQGFSDEEIGAALERNQQIEMANA